jgi:hypothetical protein
MQPFRQIETVANYRALRGSLHRSSHACVHFNLIQFPGVSQTHLLCYPSVHTGIDSRIGGPGLAVSAFMNVRHCLLWQKAAPGSSSTGESTKVAGRTLSLARLDGQYHHVYPEINPFMLSKRKGRLISFRMTEREYADLQKLADRHGDNVSETARLGIVALLQDSVLEDSIENKIKDLETRARAVFFEMRLVLGLRMRINDQRE